MIFNPSEIKIPRKGMSAFMGASLGYLRNDARAKKRIKKHKSNFKLVLHTPDWPNSALILIQEDDIKSYAISPEDVQDSTKWNTRITFSAPVAFEFFMGNFKPAIKAFFKGQMRIKKPLNLIKILWFVVFSIKFYSTNRSLARSMFWKMYNYDH